MEFSSRLPKDPQIRKLCESLEQQGWHLTRRGFPDLFLWKNGAIAFIKIKKSNSQKLRPAQQLLLQSLANAGIPTFYWTSASGLITILPTPPSKGRGND